VGVNFSILYIFFAVGLSASMNDGRADEKVERSPDNALLVLAVCLGSRPFLSAWCGFIDRFTIEPSGTAPAHSADASAIREDAFIFMNIHNDRWIVCKNDGTKDKQS
jgi:hypothetical protein